MAAGPAVGAGYGFSTGTGAAAGAGATAPLLVVGTAVPALRSFFAMTYLGRNKAVELQRNYSRRTMRAEYQESSQGW